MSAIVLALFMVFIVPAALVFAIRLIETPRETNAINYFIPKGK